MGNVTHTQINRETVFLTEENETMVLTAIVKNHHASQSRLAAQCDMSRKSVVRIFRKYKFHPYRIQLHQELFEGNSERRFALCQWLATKLQPHLSILWSDEATFHNNGCANRHNFHYYVDVNLHQSLDSHRQNNWSINVWGEILGHQTIGPFSINSPLNQQKCTR